MNIYAQAAGGAYRMHYTAVSKQAVAFRVDSSFGTCTLFRVKKVHHRAFVITSPVIDRFSKFFH